MLFQQGILECSQRLSCPKILPQTRPLTRPLPPLRAAYVLDSHSVNPLLNSATSMQLAQSSANNVAPAATLESAPGVATPSVAAVHNSEEMASILAENADKLVIVMCKARGCRPCKAFARKYARLAEAYTDSVFLEITGDESSSTRLMMIDWSIRSTPTFLYFRNGEQLGQHTGINEDKFKIAVGAHLRPEEQGYLLPSEATEPAQA